ncbi:MULTISPECIES: CerR family C-terminal domain-containing protein [Providencia]|uniref:CerR family C-terminal domain-containing protein n=1 Tax=Providencia stuartii TaxID=588 RepID=A0ABD5L2K0_PROST|nr:MULTISPECIES: CerR family C-terminal domain-containing protein [Providencia]ELR5043177.1 CerR family C-terminal domain-containing protein [Providencia rettgeri]ELR5291049.1 CerR family C-terminal domain-containing protein [Providencia stuartii]MCR4180262.1 CerR family C-terminal domain-containing protein [Providencia vermicola]URE76922.1 CerR family C-terminal domain-containing protein [Providencia stuartii]
MTETNKNTLSSELTKEKLINEGIKLFALHGIAGVRTRQLADNAGVNQSAIPYHMGGKLGVYSAVIQKIASDLAAASHPHEFDRAFTKLTQQSSRQTEEANALLHMLINGLGNALLQPAHNYYSVLILREQLEPTENYQIIYRDFIEPFHIRLSGLIQFITQLDEQTAIIRAHAMIGQVLGFVVAKRPLLKRLNQDNIDQSLLDEILQQISLLASRALRV